MLWIPHCLDSRLTDGGKVVSLTHPPQLTPQKHNYFYVSGTHVCYRLSEVKIYLIHYRTRDHPVCSIVVKVNVSLSKGPNRVSVSLFSPEDGKRSSFRNVVVSNI
jgi:hypothetical protein